MFQRHLHYANDIKTFLKHFSDCLFYFCSTCVDSFTDKISNLHLSLAALSIPLWYLHQQHLMISTLLGLHIFSLLGFIQMCFSPCSYSHQYCLSVSSHCQFHSILKQSTTAFCLRNLLQTQTCLCSQQFLVYFVGTVVWPQRLRNKLKICGNATYNFAVKLLKYN